MLASYLKLRTHNFTLIPDWDNRDRCEVISERLKDKIVNVISDLRDSGVNAMCLAPGESYSL